MVSKRELSIPHKAHDAMEKGLALLYDKSDYQGSVKQFERATQEYPDYYEAYTEMATAQMRKIGEEIAERWPEARVAMAHRTGRLEIGEASVVVSVSCPHRAEAIAACKWGIDRLKESVPIWKKEHAADGTYWIEGDEAKPTA